jgi:hypothetical protein
MKKKYFVLIMAIVVFVAFFIYSGTETDMKTVKKIGEKKGPVTFNHTAHSKLDKCDVCHHSKEDKGDKKVACTKCHSDKKGMKEMHKNCIKQCHKKDKKGPTKCNDCHKKKAA